MISPKSPQTNVNYKVDKVFSLKNEEGNTPLHLAAEYGCTGIVRLLKEKGAKRVEGIEGIVEKMPLFPAGAEHGADAPRQSPDCLDSGRR